MNIGSPAEQRRVNEVNAGCYVWTSALRGVIGRIGNPQRAGRVPPSWTPVPDGGGGVPASRPHPMPEDLTMGHRSKVPHLSLFGDATLGLPTSARGTITCNYDGREKHPTKIGDHCFVGRPPCLWAPVTIGTGAWSAAGSVTGSVPDALGGRASAQHRFGRASRRG